VTPDFARLIADIRRGDKAAQAALFNTVEEGARFLFCRKLPSQDVEDMVHELFATVVDQIRRERVREPEHLLAYIRSIARRMIGWKLKEIGAARFT